VGKIACLWYYMCEMDDNALNIKKKQQHWRYVSENNVTIIIEMSSKKTCKTMVAYIFIGTLARCVYFKLTKIASLLDIKNKQTKVIVVERYLLNETSRGTIERYICLLSSQRCFNFYYAKR